MYVDIYDIYGFGPQSGDLVQISGATDNVCSVGPTAATTSRSTVIRYTVRPLGYTNNTFGSQPCWQYRCVAVVGISHFLTARQKHDFPTFSIFSVYTTHVKAKARFHILLSCIIRPKQIRSSLKSDLHKEV